jgi:cytochrome c-type biogenesis protein CcmF
MPIGVALLVLTGVGPLIAWRKASAAQLRRRFVVPLVVAAVAAVPLLALTDLSQNAVAAGTVIAGVFVFACIVGEFWRGMKVRHALGGVSWPGALVTMVARNRRRYGGYAVHLGIVVLFIGFAGSKGFVTESDVALREGDRATVAGYTFVNEGSTSSKDAHSSFVSVQMGIFRGDDRIGTLHPGVETFAVDETRSSIVAIDSSVKRDVYLFLNQLTSDGLARVTVYINPLVLWIWIAGVIIAAGGLLAAWPTRLSPRRERAESPSLERRASA